LRKGTQMQGGGKREWIGDHDAAKKGRKDRRGRLSSLNAELLNCGRRRKQLESVERKPRKERGLTKKGVGIRKKKKKRKGQLVLLHASGQSSTNSFKKEGGKRDPP